MISFSQAINSASLLRRGSMLIVVTMLVSLFSAPALGEQRNGTDTIFRKLILERIRAYGRGDVETYTAMLAKGFVHISDLGQRRTEAQMRAYVGGHADNHASYTISNLSWLMKSGLAVVDAEVHEHLPDMELAQHETDIFVLRAGRWLYLRHQETARWEAPVAVAALGDRLDDYIGRYRTTAGTIDVIALRHGRLVDQTLPDDAQEPLVHVARGAFGFSDDPTLAVFLRDTSGKVTQCLWHLPSGQTTISKRI
jgi:hypothetical protein